MLSDIAVRPEHDVTISELSRAYNISLRTLRFYEQKGFLRPRRAGTARLYSAQDRVRLEVVLTGKKLGFSLREIDELIRSHQSKAKAEPTELIAVLNADKIQAQLDQLQRQKADIDEAIAELKGALV